MGCKTTKTRESSGVVEEKSVLVGVQIAGILVRHMTLISDAIVARSGDTDLRAKMDLLAAKIAVLNGDSGDDASKANVTAKIPKDIIDLAAAELDAQVEAGGLKTTPENLSAYATHVDAVLTALASAAVDVAEARAALVELKTTIVAAQEAVRLAELRKTQDDEAARARGNATVVGSADVTTTRADATGIDGNSAATSNVVLLTPRRMAVIEAEREKAEAERREAEIARLSADKATANGWTKLHAAVYAGDWAAVQVELERNAPILQDTSAIKALPFAVAQDGNRATEDGYAARYQRCVDAVKLEYERICANVADFDARGWTQWHHAVATANVSKVEQLLAMGVGIPDNIGEHADRAEVYDVPLQAERRSSPGEFDAHARCIYLVKTHPSVGLEVRRTPRAAMGY